MFNRREQQALVGLAAVLLVGSGAAVGDWLRPGALEEFRVVPRAVLPPPVLELALAEPAPYRSTRPRRPNWSRCLRWVPKLPR